MMKRTTTSCMGTAALLALFTAPLASAGDGRSAPLAKELSTLMAQRQLDSLAARDPQSPDRFIAALLFPGVQLLLVSAQYPAAPELEAQLTQRNYREVYTALQQPVSAASRVFFLDLGCDGLKNGDNNIDVLYEGGTTQTLFDGNWKKQGLSETAYVEKLQQSDARYTQLLTILLETLKSNP